ncbi:acyl-CoA dehydrogenase FadE [Vibrio viridaestus]|uniref:Acyl-coenzyme A dehydrogenase n=1 Tax=Vibrio viridaestus TaxID=2487322 RepID=A0A3N9U739_9VIBR|nr:acyl-CoA dehydrogenase FadE [Vibrio viridaestus]RQW63966.1 acyl-CoA dehydrogenase [Vibrio viridaestus]
MNLILSLIILILISGLCCYHRLNNYRHLAFIYSSLIVLTVCDIATFFVWVLVITFSVIVNIPSLRKKWISSFILKRLKKQLPTMSKTEKEALDAGTIWWEAELFRGRPNWKSFAQYPRPTLTQEEKDFIDGPVNHVCRMVNDFTVTHEMADLPPEIWDYLKVQGFFALIIEKKYGGRQFSAYAQSVILQKLAGVSTVLAITVGVPNSLGPGELLQHYGTEEQKRHYLPRLASGKEIPCFALTSPEAGSDASSIPDFGIVCYGQWEGKNVLGMKLTWNKRYITLAPVATVLGLAFKLKDPDHLIGEEENLGITCALIPTNMEGVKIGRRHFPLNIPFQNGPTQGKELFVPLDFIIGGPKMAGQGWRMLVECLSVGRGITLPSNSTGIVKQAALSCGAYARIRRQFKQPIGYMEGIEEPLARIAANAYLMDAACQMTVTGIELGQKPSIISAIVKYNCTHRAQQCLKDAMDIVGGKGICLGPNNFLARNYQGAPIAITVEGANILTRSMIIFGQGAIRCHPYLVKEIELMSSTDPSVLEEFDQTLFKHINYTFHNAAKSLWLSLTDGLFSDYPFHDRTKRHYQRINRYSAGFAFLADVMMLSLGGQLKRKERLSARLADMHSQLFLLTATLKRYQNDGSYSEDLPLVNWALEDGFKQFEQAMDALFSNFPSSVMAKLLRIWLMPYGLQRKGPSDELEHDLALLVQKPGSARNRLGTGQFWEASSNNPSGQVYQALNTILGAEPIFEKICQLKGKRYPFRNLDAIAVMAREEKLISDREAQVLTEAERIRLLVINVDDFAPEKLKAN